MKPATAATTESTRISGLTRSSLTRSRFRCDRREDNCSRCRKARVSCVRGPSLRRQRAPRSKRQSSKISSERTDDASSNQGAGTVKPEDSSEDKESNEIDFRVADASKNFLQQATRPNSGQWGACHQVPLSQPQLDAAPGTSEPRPFLPYENHLQNSYRKAGQDVQVSAYQVYDSDSAKSLGKSNTREEESRGSWHKNQSSGTPRSDVTFLIRKLTHFYPQVHEKASRVSDHLASGLSRRSILHSVNLERPPAPRRTPSGQEETQTLQLKPAFDLSQRFIESLSIGSPLAGRASASDGLYRSVLPSPASQYTDRFAGTFDLSRGSSRAPSEGAIVQHSRRGTQASTLFLLSCYLCLLDTYDDILGCFEMEVERWDGTQQVQYDGHAEAQTPQIRGSAARMVQMLRRSQDILYGLREAIRSSSTIWDSDAADETSHSTEVIRPAVLAVQIRDCDLGNRIGRLHQSLAIKYGTK